MDTPPPTNTTAMPSKPEILQQEHTHPDPKTSIRNRLKHFTLAWFLSTMSTGGLALALADTPHQFPGLYYIGLTLFFANILLFLILCTCTFLRAIYHPTHFTASFSHPQESLFLGAFWLSLSVILAGIQTYGLTHNPSLSSSSASSAAAAGYPWLVDTVYVSYYIYAASSLVNSIFQYWILIAYSKSRPVPYLPAIFLAGYSAMLTGTLASMIVHTQPGHRVMGIVVSGVAYQGFGWCVSFVAIVAYVRNVLDNGFPAAAQVRPGLFIPVGSCAYTIVALIGLANAINDEAEGEVGYFVKHPAAPEILRVLALFTGIFLYVFAFWLFAIAVLGNVGVLGKMRFSLTWWAFIFPNVGFMLSTSILGRELESEGILWVASGMTALLVVIWLVTVVGCVRAVWKREIVWPGRDEDRNR